MSEQVINKFHFFFNSTNLNNTENNKDFLNITNKQT